MAKAVVIVRLRTGKSLDMELPTDIYANDLIRALYETLRLPGVCPVSIRSENPIACVYGDRPLSVFGIRDGSILYI